MKNIRCLITAFFVVLVGITCYCQQNILMIVDEVPSKYELVSNIYTSNLKAFLVNSDLNVLDKKNFGEIQYLKELIEKGTMDRIEDIYDKWGLEATTKILKISFLVSKDPECLIISTELFEMKGNTLFIDTCEVQQGETYKSKGFALINGKEILFKLENRNMGMFLDRFIMEPQFEVFIDKPILKEGEKIEIFFNIYVPVYLSVFYVKENYLEEIILNEPLIPDESQFSLKGIAALPIGIDDEYLETLLFVVTKEKLDLEGKKTTKIKELNNKLEQKNSSRWEYRLVSYVIVGR